MKIVEYPTAESLTHEDNYIVGGSSTKKIAVDDALLAEFDAMSEEPWVNHRNIFRGKNLGNEFTAAQKAAIRDGSFKDLYVGDYWVNGYTKWRIADINYWWSQNENLNHLVIIPDGYLYLSKWSDNIDNGYLGSYIHTEGLNQARSLINGIFGSENLYSHTDRLTNSKTSVAVVQIDIMLPTEGMIKGSNDSSVTFSRINSVSASYNQLSLMSLNRRFINNDNTADIGYWTSNIISDNIMIITFGKNSIIGNINSNQTSGVRPVFAIKG